MTGLRLSVPVACFRKGLAREYFETEPLPPPSTCYGFLLSLVGETDRGRHVGARVCPTLLTDGPHPDFGDDGVRLREPSLGVVLRTVWRLKSPTLGASGNTRPDYQQLLTGVHVVVWLDSTGEAADGPTLEDRVAAALDDPASVNRFGGLSLGESTHLIDTVSRYEGDGAYVGDTYLTAERGRHTLPVWVDHVGSAGTRHAVGDLETGPAVAPPRGRMPQILPPD